MELGTLTKLVSGNHGYWDSVNNWVYNTLECHEIKNLANQQHFQSNVGLTKMYANFIILKNSR